MTPAELTEFVHSVAPGNLDACKFMLGWFNYLHAIDDIVDKDAPPEDVIKVTRWAAELYSMPFYVANCQSLFPVVQLISCTYEDSVELGNNDEQWAKHTADVIRHTGADMIRVVAYIVGGYDHMRKISMTMRKNCYLDHHTSDGQPI